MMTQSKMSTRQILSSLEDKKNLVCSGFVFSGSALIVNALLPKWSPALDVAALLSLAASNALMIWNHRQKPQQEQSVEHHANIDENWGWVRSPV